MNLRRFIFRSLLYTFLIITIFAGGLGAFTWFYKDRIIQAFVDEANRYLNTPVKVDKIDFSVWTNFPQASISLHNIEIEGTLPGDSLKMLKAKDVYFSFNVWDIWEGRYDVKEIKVRMGRCNLAVNKAGLNNYDIFKKSTSTEEVPPITFDLKDILMDDVSVRYINAIKEQDIAIHTDHSFAKFRYLDDLMNISLKGRYLVNQVQIGGKRYFTDKLIDIKSELSYQKSTRLFVIQPSALGLQQANFELSGKYDGKKDFIHLFVSGKNSTVQLLLSFLPKDLYDDLSKYHSKGNVYFNAVVDGQISEKESPEIKVSFGCEQATFYHPETKESLDEVVLTGSFNNGAKTGVPELELRNVSGLLENKKFSGNFLMTNFKDPFVKADFSGEIDLASLVRLFPNKDIEKAKGQLHLMLDFAGRLEDLKDPKKKNKIIVDGDMKCENLFLKLQKYKQPLQSGRLEFQFNNNDVNVVELSGQLGNTDARLEGLFTNVVSFFLFPDEKLHVQAKYASNFTDLNELLNIDPEKENKDQTSTFALPERLDCDLNCKVDRLLFRRFDLRQLKGHVAQDRTKITSKGLSSNVAGGSFKIAGSLDATNLKKINIDTKINMNGIHIDSALFLFENFGQKFITDKNLQGQLVTEISLKLTLNEKMEINLPSVVSDINVTIKNGRLKNFEPMQKLSKFIDEDELADIRFSELKNNFHIQDQTVIIPEMEIKSNVNTVSIMGTHTFDNKMAYKVKVSLKNPKKRDKDERFGVIESDGKGGVSLLLTVSGTSDDLKIAYDKATAKQNIKEGWKKEKEEFKQIFKKDPDPARTDPKKPVELNPEEFMNMD